MEFTHEGLVAMLESSSNIESLILREERTNLPVVTEDLLRRLTFSSTSGPPLVPRLTNLEITVDEEDIGLVMNMIESRFHPSKQAILGSTAESYVDLDIREFVLDYGGDDSEEGSLDLDSYTVPVAPSDEYSFIPRLKALREGGLRISTSYRYTCSVT